MLPMRPPPINPANGVAKAMRAVGDHCVPDRDRLAKAAGRDCPASSGTASMRPRMTTRSHSSRSCTPGRAGRRSVFRRALLVWNHDVIAARRLAWTRSRCAVSSSASVVRAGEEHGTPVPEVVSIGVWSFLTCSMSGNRFFRASLAVMAVDDIFR